MKTNLNGLRRLAFGALALAVALAATVPALSGQASAASVTSRAIKLSTSAVSATSVSHEITFNVATAGAVQGVVVDYCTSPLPGTVCTLPTGFSVGAGTTTGSIAGMTGTWSGTSANSNRTLVLSLGTPGGSAAANAAASFTLTTGVNPSSVGTFYARILTFATAAAATAQAAANSGDGSSLTGVVDSGGIAMSTAVQITLTAKVQESLTFCVYTGASCGTGTAVNLGDTNGVLSSAGHFVDVTTRYDIATNAANNAVVRLKGGLPTSGANTIASFGTTATAPSTAGASQFGLCNYQSTGSGLTPAAPYNHASCNTTTQTAGTGSTGGTGSAQFAFDTAATTSTYGDDLSTKTAGSTSQGTVAFAGFANTTQQAGVYASTYDFIATGTY